MRFASLGSGSEGNALVVEVGQTRLMMDCGFGLAECVYRLERLRLQPEDITAILITHEHSDHIAGAARFTRKYRTPVWLTHGTLPWLALEVRSELLHRFDSHSKFAIQDIEVHPFPVPHDAREPVQFVFSDGVCRLGVVTDLGSSTPHVEACLSGVDALVLECNHDLPLLMNGPYPDGLKQRVAGRFGHLDNGSAARLLERIDRRRLKHVLAAHLSRQNNRPELARTALAGALDCSEMWIGIANQAEGFAWRDVA
ncbi:MAG: MBL fold metallo-hydrolase [Burkholderiales bacterium]|nr:MBL fold metallo-hydrolase [Burkholderiales bacterium]